MNYGRNNSVAKKRTVGRPSRWLSGGGVARREHGISALAPSWIFYVSRRDAVMLGKDDDAADAGRKCRPL